MLKSFFGKDGIRLHLVKKALPNQPEPQSFPDDIWISTSSESKLTRMLLTINRHGATQCNCFVFAVPAR